MSMDERLQNLEIKVAYLEKTLDDLSEAMLNQDRTMEGIRKEIVAMRKILEMEEAGDKPFNDEYEQSDRKSADRK